MALDLHCGTSLLEETLEFMFNFVKPNNLPYLEVYTRHWKDSSYPWKIHAKYFFEYQKIVFLLNVLKILKSYLLPIFFQSIHWHPLHEVLSL